MEYTQDMRTARYAMDRSRTLVEALPWLKDTTGQTVVIKYGGSAMEDDALLREVTSDIVLLKLLGVRPVLVHGGGKAVSRAMRAADIEVEFKDGMRVTTPEAMDVVRQVLVGDANARLVMAINVHGALAVGLSGMDANVVCGEPLSADLGRVGRVTKVNASFIRELVDADRIPVLSSVASDGEGGCLNVNADVVAGEVAAALGAHKLVYITDVDGIYEDFSDKFTLISSMTQSEAQGLLDSGKLDSGMIPKVSSCVAALAAGVPRAHVINGMRSHSLLCEVLTDDGVGTMICRDEGEDMGDDDGLGTAPLDTLAQRLAE